MDACILGYQKEVGFRRINGCWGGRGGLVLVVVVLVLVLVLVWTVVAMVRGKWEMDVR